MQELLKYKLQSNGPSHTHTAFTQHNIVKLSVPYNELRGFYANYLLCKDSLTLTEKSKSTVQFFADIDCPFYIFDEGYVATDSNSEILEFIDFVRETFEDVIEEVTKNTFECFIAFRVPYKCHFYFPKCFLEASVAKIITLETERIVSERYSWVLELKKQKKNIFDVSVYTSGLRILGCKKDFMSRNGLIDEKLRHNILFPNVEWSGTYRLGSIEKISNNKTYLFNNNS